MMIYTNFKIFSEKVLDKGRPAFEGGRPYQIFSRTVFN